MDNEPKVLTLTARELLEIKHALFYNAECNHGTVGHNMLVLIAKMSIHLGFQAKWTETGAIVLPPDGVEVSG